LRFDRLRLFPTTAKRGTFLPKLFSCSIKECTSHIKVGVVYFLLTSSGSPFLFTTVLFFTNVALDRVCDRNVLQLAPGRSPSGLFGFFPFKLVRTDGGLNRLCDCYIFEVSLGGSNLLLGFLFLPVSRMEAKTKLVMDETCRKCC
jgi:hypothetical protein